MQFYNAYILGVQRRSDYFGERTANYRTVDTVSIEGYIDVRDSNPDYKGVRQALSDIDSYVAAASTEAVIDDVIINGTGFGAGRLTSLDFPASTTVDEDQIRIGKYTASIEIYNSGNLRDSLENASVPYPQFLEEFSEDFSVSLQKDNTYSLTHNLSITYLSGVSEGITVDPISTAKTLAKNLFSQIPTQFSTVIPDSYGSIASSARQYFNESYNIIDGSSTFSKEISLFPSGMSNYSLKVSNNFEFDGQGIVKVSENGEVAPRTTEYLEEAREALDIEIAKSYNRCNTVYNSYKNYLNTGVADNNHVLYNEPLTITKNVDNSAGSSTYSVTYTDNLGYANSDIREERSIAFNIDAAGVRTVSENGTVISINSKSVNFDPYALIPSRSTVFQRCKNWYDYQMPSPNSYHLKNFNNKFTVPRYGKQISYTYTFTDDGSIFTEAEDSLFVRKNITNSDRIGVPNQSLITFPNTDELLHTANQTSLGTRSTKFDGQLRRAKYANTLNSRVIPQTAIDTAKSECIVQAYNVYAINRNIRSLDRGQIYVGSANYSFGSNNSFSMNVDCTFPMLRNDGNTELNLSF